MNDIESPVPTEGKNKGGRPLKFTSVEELDAAIDSYFQNQDPHIEERLVESGLTEKGETIFSKRKVMTEQKPYLVTGLAVHLGVTRQTLLNYREREQFFDSIERALGKCEAYAEGQLYGPYARGALFNLNNNYNGKYQGWSDKQSIDHTTDGKPIDQVQQYRALTTEELRKLATEE